MTATTTLITESPRFEEGPIPHLAEAGLSDVGDCPVRIGQVLAGCYSLEVLLGRGGYGWVFSAIDIAPATPERVAIKILRPDRLEGDNGIRRFITRELALLRRVQERASTPNVVQALRDEIVSHEGIWFLVMEYIEGPTLSEEIAYTVAMDIERVRTVALRIACGLEAIHACEGVHRDLKPSNIRLRAGIDPVILDLGIAKALWDTQEITATGHAPMTPKYAAPEQLDGGDVGPAADIYALGLILYEMLVGHVPLLRPTTVGTIAARMTSDGPDPRTVRQSISKDLAELTMCCLMRDPTQRPTAIEVVAAIVDPPRRSRRQILPASAVILTALVCSAILARDCEPDLARAEIKNVWQNMPPLPLDPEVVTDVPRSSSVVDTPLSRLTVAGKIAGVGARHWGYAVTVDGYLWQWGGINDSRPFSKVPQQIEKITDATYVALGGSFHIILNRNGLVSLGVELGVGEKLQLKNVTAVAAGDRHVIAIVGYDEVWISDLCDTRELPKHWEPNLSSVRGIEFRRVPGLKNIVDVAAYGERFVARTSEGAVLQWGLDETAEGGARVLDEPIDIPLPGKAVAVATGAYHSLALLEDESLWGWGDNSLYQLGVNQNERLFSTPRKIRERVHKIAAAAVVSMIVDDRGYVWASGNGAKETNLGGRAITRTSFKRFLDVKDIEAIATNGEYCLGVGVNGEVWQWGWNTRADGAVAPSP